jgi:glutathione S-transferase
MKLYAHPFSSYCQKVFIAFYENATPFELCMLSGDYPQNLAEQAALWPLGKMPLLVDGDRTVMEATSIIEYLAVHHPGPVKLIPTDSHAALEVRMLDRIFDNYVSTPMQKIVLDRLRQPERRDAHGVAEAREMLDTTYGWLNDMMKGRPWAAGAAFSLADCAAAPGLFYADWAHPIGERFPIVRAYRQRLLARPSYKRAVDDARPYRAGFPLGAPDRD